MKRYGPSRRRAKNASGVSRIFVQHPQKTFATISAKRRYWQTKDLIRPALCRLWSDQPRCGDAQVASRGVAREKVTDDIYGRSPGTPRSARIASTRAITRRQKRAERAPCRSTHRHPLPSRHWIIAAFPVNPILAIARFPWIGSRPHNRPAPPQACRG
jgi:hypothetical protein